jgi:very-short-patch-repair endonuclease
MGGKGVMADREVARLAARQHNVISFPQLIAAGLTRRMIETRVQRGMLHRVHRSVYSVGTHRLTREGRFLAAALATGGVVSHESAAYLWGIRDGLLSPVHVSVEAGGRKHRRGIVTHRRTGVIDTTTHLGIPVTTVTQTLRDLSQVLPREEHEQALEEAHFKSLLDRSDPRVRRLLKSYEPGTKRTRSRNEKRFLAFCSQHDLPTPVMNHPIGDDTVDAYFPDHNLIVEIDPWHTHRMPGRFKDDRARDRRHLAQGIPTVRLTDDDFTAATADEIRAALRRAR